MKTIWGLFGTYQDAGGALDEFRRRGFAAEDLSAVALPDAAQGGAGTGKRRGPAPAQGGRHKKHGRPRTPGPAPEADAPTPGRPGGQQARLPGVRTVRVSGAPPLLAAGRLATALEQAQVPPPTPAAPAEAAPRRQVRANAMERGGLAGVLVGLGLPESYAGSYAAAVRRGQVLLAVRVADERERDAVMLMRRYRVMQLAGQPVGDEA